MAEEHGFESIGMPEHVVFPRRCPPNTPTPRTGCHRCRQTRRPAILACHGRGRGARGHKDDFADGLKRYADEVIANVWHISQMRGIHPAVTPSRQDADMGRSNRERRRIKQAKRRRGRGTGEQTNKTRQDGRQGAGADDASLVDKAILAAAHAQADGRPDDELIRRLCTGTGLPGGPSRVAERLLHLLAQRASLVIRQGWRPEDLRLVLRRHVGASAASLVAWVVADPGRRSDGDREFAGTIGRPLDPRLESWSTDVRAAVDTLGLMPRLPALPNLGSAVPRRPRFSKEADEKLFERIRGLLAKAESTDFAEEAEAFMAKAQELMTRHNLDRAMLVDTATRNGSWAADVRRCWLDDPYLQAKAFLLSVVAGANRCQAIASRELGFVTLVGHPDDLDVTELLFTSLLVQATRRMTAAHSRRPAFRRSFLVAYATRIGVRLREAADVATESASHEFGDRLLPVLALRQDDVDEVVQHLFPGMVRDRVSASDPSGWAAGTAAADLAELSIHPQLVERLA